MKKNKIMNRINITVPAKSINEAFCRVTVGAFATQLDPNLEELCDIKTAVSEAVTNCIVHAYNGNVPENKKIIKLSALYRDDGLLVVKIKDYGSGIADIHKAMEPMYTTGNEERSGMGFSIMESFTDSLIVKSKPQKGTTVTLKKYIGGKNQ